MRSWMRLALGAIGMLALGATPLTAQAQNSAPASSAMAAVDHSAQPVPIDLASVPPIGDPNAKVVLVAYVCGRCPFCSKLVPELVRQVTDGPLKGKARLYVKMFPVRSHPHAGETAQAVLAAGQMGKFWPFLLKLYESFDSFSVDKLADYAEAVGLNRAEFVRLSAEPSVRARLVDSKKEGLRNKVEATPTLFVNGYRYSGDLTAAAIADAAQDEARR